MDVDVKNEFLQNMYETIEIRVGMVLAKDMSDQRLDEFERYIDSDEEGRLPGSRKLSQLQGSR